MATITPFRQPSRPGRRAPEVPGASYIDYSLVFTLIFLIGFGLIMIYSTSSYVASMSGKGSAFYMIKQFNAVLLGTVLMVVFAIVPYHFWERFAFVGYAVSAVMILLVLTPLGKNIIGATRWIYIGGISIQPAEVAKMALILFMSYMCCRIGKAIVTPKGFFLLLAIPLPIFLLLWRVTKNLSSGLIVYGIAVLIMFVASPDYKRYILMALAAAAVAILVVSIIVNVPESSALSYRGRRVLAWLDPGAYASSIGFQTLQALYAIGSGGMFGKGLGQSMQKMGFIPEPQNDMIFSIICEELGLFGAVAVILLFLLLIWRCMIIANNASDMFGALLVTGVIGHIAIQVILNIAVCTNTIPNTGVSLPFISYGGTSVMLLMAEMGVVFSVSRGIKLKELS
ncbi:MAG: cell division protein FtsW [Lachnospiraceae bacterium]|nr:cell division protein FtsW [Lachnospiraceae bacterium]